MEVFITFLESINLAYIIICNTATWLVVSAFTRWWKRPTTTVKKLISATTAIVLGVLMHFAFGAATEPLFYGFFLQFISWDYFFKPIINRIQKEIEGDFGTGEANKRG